jgi:dTDP-D-glucose 4,6-dehydratase
MYVGVACACVCCAGTDEEVAEAVAANVVFVPDRPFNDLRYPLDCSQLTELGWRESVDWEEGLRLTVEWYRRFSGNWEDVESALVAHPRRGLLASQMSHHTPKK